MLTALRTLRLVTASAGGAALRRPLGKRRHPRWSLLYEGASDLVRAQFASVDVDAPEPYRRVLDRVALLTTPPARRHVRVERRTGDASGPDGAWLRLRGDRRSRAVLYLHGGGYVIGSVASVGDLAARIARAAEADTFVLEYRLAPEHPFPAAVDDAIAAYRWLLAEGYGASDVLVAGDSAGGGLTLATLLRARDAGEPLPAGAALISPWVDLEDDGAGASNWQGLDTLSSESVRRYRRAYLAGADATDPLASPVHADLAGLPPLLVHAGEVELLRDQIRRLVDRARSARVDVEYEQAPDMVHAWHYFAWFCEPAREAIAQIGAFAQACWDGTRT